MTSWPSKSTLQRPLDLEGLHYTTSERSGPFWQSMLHNFLSRPLSFLDWTTAMLFWLDFHQTQSNLYKWFRMQRHDWSSTRPCYTSLCLSVLATDCSSHPVQDTDSRHWKKIFFLFSLIFACLACTYLNKAWNWVLRALPLSVCLFKMNCLMYSPVVSCFG